MSKIIVCWNDDAFGRELKNKAKEDACNYEVCISKKDWDKYKIRTEVKKVKILIVLCELSWDHDTTVAPLTEFRGISLAQHLRAELGYKFPIVFLSILSPEQLVASPSIYADIVLTPALQHAFLQLPINATPRNLLSTFFEYSNKLRMQNDKDLAYTRMFYCDVQGIIKRIRHSINGANRDKLIRQLKSLVEIEFPNKQNELNELLANSGNLSRFCDTLIESRAKAYSVLALNEKAKRILYIEDDIEDAYVKKFCEYCNRHKDEFDLHIVSDKSELESVWKEGYSNYFADQDIVICDIELRYDGKLEYMGYDIIDKMTAKSKKPVYYIVTNMSRSVYDQIKTDAVKRITLKSEVWGAETNIEKFLYGVKEVLKDREANLQQTRKDCDIVFNYFYSYMKTWDPFVEIEYKDVKDMGTTITMCGWKKINQFVDQKALQMFDFFTGKYNDIKKTSNGTNAFLIFNRCCEAMRKKLDENNLRGGKEWNAMDMTNIPSPKDLNRFVKILVLRRFFLRVKKWVCGNDIMVALEEYRDGKGQKLSLQDLSFRAVGGQYKTLSKSKDDWFAQNLETEGVVRLQSRFDATLLWAAKSMQLTEEEKEFVNWIP